jgi:iron complex outermembrane receptor protein
MLVVASPIIEANQVDGFAGFSTQATQAQIRELGALDLAAALRMTPGVQMSRYNEIGSYSGDQGGNVYIRGQGTSRPGSEIKTYLDGIPVYMGVWGHPLMDLLPLNGMQSVDIYKGPQNPISGNNFSAIDLTSKRASQEGIQAEVNAAIGSFSTQILQADLAGRHGATDYALALGAINSDGDRPNADGQLRNAMGRISTRLNPAWSVGVSFLSVDNEVGDPGDNRYSPFTAATNANWGNPGGNGLARNDSTSHLLTAFVSHQHADWHGDFKVYQNRGHNNLTNDPNWGTFDSRFKMTGFRWKETLSPWKDGQLLLGIDQDSTSGSVSGPHVGSAVGTPFAFGTTGSAEVPTFRVTSAFAGVNHHLSLSDRWTLQPSLGVRFYDSNIHGSKAAPNAGLNWIADNLTVYANYTQGLLYPGPETYTLTRAIPMAFAADNGWERLSPTEDQHSEVGVQWDISAQTHVDLSLFRDEVSKRYVWTGFYMGAILNPASGTWSNAFPTYRISGLEASVKHRINAQWSVFGGLTHLNSSLDNLPYAPKLALSAGLTGVVEGYRLSLDAQHQSRMYSMTHDRGSFNPDQVDAFTVANARIAQPLPLLGKKGEVYVVINNLLDADYQYNAGYPMPGRNFRLGLSASF